jgi:PAS domain-containing protein
MPGQPPQPSLSGFSIDLYEAADDEHASPAEARTLGLIWARVIPHAEATAHSMIRATEARINAAGVTSLHVGRRVVGNQEELLVVAGWRDRLALHAFAKGRSPSGPIDPSFLALLSEWHFSTYDCLAPGAAGLPEPGAAVLLTDTAGAIVDASPAIEDLLGVPGELVLGRPLLSLRPHQESAADSPAWSAALSRETETALRLEAGDGRVVTLRARSANECPRPGFRAMVLSRPDAGSDRRSVAEVVEEAFGEPAEKSNSRPVAGQA